MAGLQFLQMQKAPCTPAECLRQTGAAQPDQFLLQTSGQHRRSGACPRAGLPYNYSSLIHLVMADKHRFYLAEFDSKAADLDLLIGPAHIIKRAVLAPAGKIAGSVHPGSGRTKRISDKTVCRQIGSAQVTPCEAAPDTYISPVTPGVPVQGIHQAHIHLNRESLDRSGCSLEVLQSADRGKYS